MTVNPCSALTHSQLKSRGGWQTRTKEPQKQSMCQELSWGVWQKRNATKKEAKYACNLCDCTKKLQSTLEKINLQSILYQKQTVQYLEKRKLSSNSRLCRKCELDMYFCLQNGGWDQINGSNPGFVICCYGAWLMSLVLFVC